MRRFTYSFLFIAFLAMAVAMTACGGGGGGGGGGDTTAPTITARAPDAGATDVPVTTVVTVTFSEAMDDTTIDTTSFIVDDGASVTGSVSYDNATRKATFTPSADLEYNTLHTVTLADTLADLAGNTLGVDDTWSFTTAAFVVPTGIWDTHLWDQSVWGD